MVDQKTAAVGPGAVKRVTDLFERASHPVHDAASAVGRGLFGGEKGDVSGIAHHMGNIAGGAMKFAPHAAVGALAIRGGQHLSALGDTTTGHAVKAFIPGTPEYQQKSQELALSYGGFPTYQQGY